MSIFNKLAKLLGIGHKTSSNSAKHLTFEKLNNRWYIVLPHYPFSHDNLQMVAGADDLLEYFSEGKDHVSLDVTINVPAKEDELHLIGVDADYGYDYFLPEDHPSGLINLWLCPVTCYVFGSYPGCINISNISAY